MRRLDIGLLLLITIVLLGTVHDALAQGTASASSQQSGLPYTLLPPVVVTATRTDISPDTSTAQVTIVDQDAIEQSPDFMLDDALRDIPGFNTFRRSSSIVTAPADDPEAQGVTLRGVGPGGASRALVLLDGIPINDAFGGWLYWDEIPLDSIDRVELVYGGGSNLWGSGAEGGVINIISKRPEANDFEAQGSYGNRNTTLDGVTGNYVNGPFRVRLDGDFFNTNGWNIVEQGFRGPIDQNSSSIHELFNGRVEYDVAGLSTFLRGSYYNQNLDLGTPFRAASATRGFVNAGGSLDTESGDHFHLSLYGHLTNYSQNFSIVNGSRTAETPSQRQTVPSNDEGGFLTWTRTFFKYHQISAGGDFRIIDGQSEDRYYNAAGTTVIDHQTSSGHQNFFGLYLEDVFRPISQLEVDASVRGDFFQSVDGEIQNDPLQGQPTTTTFAGHSRTATSPKLGVRYGPFEWLTLRGSIYEAFRAPTLAELYRQSSVEDLVLLPNPNLSPEFLEGGEIGLVFTKLPGITFGATAYLSVMHDPIINVVTAANPVTGEDAERTRVNGGRSRIRGYQFDLAYSPDWLDHVEWCRRLGSKVTLTASFLESEATLVHNPPDSTLEGKRLALVPWQTLSLGLQYSDAVLGNAAVQELYYGKQFEDSDNMDVQPAYWVTNLTLSKPLSQITSNRWLTGISIFLKFQNLFNQTYIVDLGGGIPKVGTPFMVLGGLTAPINF